MDINSLTPLVSTPAKNITPIHSFSTGSRTHFVSSTISLLNIFILMFFLYCTFWGAEPHLRKSLMLSSSQRSPVECISECHRLMPHLWVLLHWLENTVLHIRCHVRHYFPTTIHHSTPSVIKNNMRKLQEAVQKDFIPFHWWWQALLQTELMHRWTANPTWFMGFKSTGQYHVHTTAKASLGFLKAKNSNCKEQSLTGYKLILL